MSPVIDWNADKVLREVSGRVINGMDKACKFAAGQAKSKARKRTGTLVKNIDYEVIPKGNDVVGYIGVRKGGALGSNQGEAFYGYFQELGTKKMRASPFLRPAVFSNGDQIVKLISEG